MRILRVPAAESSHGEAPSSPAPAPGGRDRTGTEHDPRAPPAPRPLAHSPSPTCRFVVPGLGLCRSQTVRECAQVESKVYFSMPGFFWSPPGTAAAVGSCALSSRGAVTSRRGQATLYRLAAVEGPGLPLGFVVRGATVCSPGRAAGAPAGSSPRLALANVARGSGAHRARGGSTRPLCPLETLGADAPSFSFPPPLPAATSSTSWAAASPARSPTLQHAQDGS